MNSNKITAVALNAAKSSIELQGSVLYKMSEAFKNLSLIMVQSKSKESSEAAEYAIEAVQLLRKLLNLQKDLHDYLESEIEEVNKYEAEAVDSGAGADTETLSQHAKNAAELLADDSLENRVMRALKEAGFDVDGDNAKIVKASELADLLNKPASPQVLKTMGDWLSEEFPGENLLLPLDVSSSASGEERDRLVREYMNKKVTYAQFGIAKIELQKFNLEYKDGLPGGVLLGVSLPNLDGSMPELPGQGEKGCGDPDCSSCSSSQSGSKNEVKETLQRGEDLISKFLSELFGDIKTITRR